MAKMAPEERAQAQRTLDRQRMLLSQMKSTHGAENATDEQRGGLQRSIDQLQKQLDDDAQA